MKKKYQSEALAAIHEDAEALHRIGAISPERLREFDDMCLASGKAPASSPEGAISPTNLQAFTH